MRITFIIVSIVLQLFMLSLSSADRLTQVISCWSLVLAEFSAYAAVRRFKSTFAFVPLATGVYLLATYLGWMAHYGPTTR